MTRNMSKKRYAVVQWIYEIIEAMFGVTALNPVDWETRAQIRMILYRVIAILDTIIFNIDKVQNQFSLPFNVDNLATYAGAILKMVLEKDFPTIALYPDLAHELTHYNDLYYQLKNFYYNSQKDFPELDTFIYEKHLQLLNFDYHQSKVSNQNSEAVEKIFKGANNTLTMALIDSWLLKFCSTHFKWNEATHEHLFLIAHLFSYALYSKVGKAVTDNLNDYYQLLSPLFSTPITFERFKEIYRTVVYVAKDMFQHVQQTPAPTSEEETQMRTSSLPKGQRHSTTKPIYSPNQIFVIDIQQNKIKFYRLPNANNNNNNNNNNNANNNNSAEVDVNSNLTEIQLVYRALLQKILDIIHVNNVATSPNTLSKLAEKLEPLAIALLSVIKCTSELALKVLELNQDKEFIDKFEVTGESCLKLLQMKKKLQACTHGSYNVKRAIDACISTIDEKDCGYNTQAQVQELLEQPLALCADYNQSVNESIMKINKIFENLGFNNFNAQWVYKLDLIMADFFGKFNKIKSIDSISEMKKQYIEFKRAISVSIEELKTKNLLDFKQYIIEKLNITPDRDSNELLEKFIAEFLTFSSVAEKIEEIIHQIDSELKNLEETIHLMVKEFPNGKKDTIPQEVIKKSENDTVSVSNLADSLSKTLTLSEKSDTQKVDAKKRQNAKPELDKLSDAQNNSMKFN